MSEPFKYPPKISNQVNREIYDAVQKIIGPRPFLVAIPEGEETGFGVSFCVGNLSEKGLTRFMRDIGRLADLPPTEAHECPPPTTTTPAP